MTYKKTVPFRLFPSHMRAIVDFFCNDADLEFVIAGRTSAAQPRHSEVGEPS